MFRKSLILFQLSLVFIISRANVLPAQVSETAFNFVAGAKYYSRFTAYGINLSGDNPAWGINSGLGHESGLYADVYYTRPINEMNDEQQILFDVGYELDISPRFSMYAEYGYFIFSSDTLHAFARFSGTLSLNADIDLTFFDLGLSYDRFFGGTGATYYSIDVSTFRDLGPVYLLPILQVVIMSQTVEDRYLEKGKGKKKNNETVVGTTLTGLSNTMFTLVAIFPVFDQLSITFVPSLIFYHQSELSVDSSQFIWNAGIRYRLYF
jgi:hypothetical protein